MSSRISSFPQLPLYLIIGAAFCAAGGLLIDAVKAGLGTIRYIGANRGSQEAATQ